MQIPIIEGVYTDNGPDFRVSYPVNMMPIAIKQGISNGYLRPAYGLVSVGTGPGVVRGGINWNGSVYRVMGGSLVQVLENGSITTLGDVGVGASMATFDYSFDRLAIAVNNRLYYWDGLTLTHVTDPDLGPVLSMIWVDGYFMTTDGTSLAVTELTDPMAVNPLKYGSSEIDPDPVVALLKLRNEPYAINRYTIEVFDNIGGDLFPFQRIDGAQIQKGAIGRNASCIFEEAIAFVGSGRNEALGVYIGANSVANKISTREIDKLISGYTEAQMANTLVEAKLSDGLSQLWVHLPDRTIVFDATATRALNSPAWFTLTTAINGFSQYRARHLVWCYNAWQIGDPQSAIVGRLDDTISNQYGEKIRWEFGTTIFYNEGMGAIIHELEIVALTGRVAAGSTPTISSSYSVDGENWSQVKFISAGGRGDRTKRLVWLQQGSMRNWRIQRFQGDSDAHISCARLEAKLEPLAY